MTLQQDIILFLNREPCNIAEKGSIEIFDVVTGAISVSQIPFRGKIKKNCLVLKSRQNLYLVNLICIGKLGSGICLWWFKSLLWCMESIPALLQGKKKIEAKSRMTGHANQILAFSIWRYYDPVRPKVVSGTSTTMPYIEQFNASTAETEKNEENMTEPEMWKVFFFLSLGQFWANCIVRHHCCQQELRLLPS